MIKFVHGDIFDTTASAIVIPVNTVGVMGKGLALQFKQKVPNGVKSYKSECVLKKLSIGHVMYYCAINKTYILFPTKTDWRNKSKIEYVEASLKAFAESYKTARITSVAFPRVGCGCGGLDWDKVKALLIKYLKPLNIECFIYVYK